MSSRANGKKARYRAEVEGPRGLVFILAALGTLIFFLESGLYIFLVFTGLHGILLHSCFQLRFPYDSWVQLTGLAATAFGYLLFAWSVLSRGEYATSWGMSEDQKLVTWGPYRYVRHPSYLAYFILFAGLFLTLQNLITVVPFVSIPGYLSIVAREEELLTRRFGEAYLSYQRATGKFFPKRKS